MMAAKTRSRILPTIFVLAAVGFLATVVLPTNVLNRDEELRALRLAVVYDNAPRKLPVIIIYTYNKEPNGKAQSTSGTWDRVIKVERGELVDVFGRQQTPGNVACAIIDVATGYELARDKNGIGSPDAAYCRARA